MIKRITLFILLLLVTGCNQKIIEDVNRVEKQEKTKQEKTLTIEEEQKEILKNVEKPLEEVVQENELESKKTIETEFQTVEQYLDPTDFSKRISYELFMFSNGKKSTTDFVDILMTFSSKSFHDEWLQDKNAAIQMFNNVQGMMMEENVFPVSYEITEITLSQSRNEAYFYRKVISRSQGELYYITTIVKENGEWKLADDSPSPPYQEFESQPISQGGTGNEHNGK
ncbi:hypothetical protein ACFSCX_06655 [Bacillus salitolerans]|uniref:Lipoprotein n=1 Tax=Bacillus salitolerans TaxID=1437434 RepID=A0ABW4LM38_9BACI